MKSFNIASRSLNDTCVMQLTDPETGALMFADEKETQPLTITLYGRSSKQHAVYMDKILRKQNMEKASNKKAKEKGFDELQEDNAEFLATMSHSAQNFDDNGVAIDNKEAFKKLYANPALVWIADQVSTQLGDIAAFMGK